jgi:hypothetical protein
MSVTRRHGGVLSVGAPGESEWGDARESRYSRMIFRMRWLWLSEM